MIYGIITNKYNITASTANLGDKIYAKEIKIKKLSLL